MQSEFQVSKDSKAKLFATVEVQGSPGGDSTYVTDLDLNEAIL